MEKKEVVEKLTIIFRSILKNDSLVLTNELTANDIERWDSLSHMLIITEIENVFPIKLKLKEVNKMRNVGDMIDIIISKL